MASAALQNQIFGGMRVNGQSGLFNFAHTYLNIGTVYNFLFQKHTTGRWIDYRQQSPWEDDSVSVKKIPHIVLDPDIRVFTRARKSSSFWARWIPPMPSHPLCLRPVLTLTFNIMLSCTNSHSFVQAILVSKLFKLRHIIKWCNISPCDVILGYILLKRH